MSTKVDRINGAYGQLRISGLTVNPTPEDLEIALDRLETMMAEFEGRNIGVGYNFEDQPDLNSLTHVRREFWQMIDTNLAIRLVPDFNKEVSPVLFNQASQSLSNASARVAASLVREVNYPWRQPRGSGNTLRRNRWQKFYRSGEEAPTSSDTNVIYLGDTNDYIENYTAYLDSGETIDSYTITADPGLTIVSDSSTDNEISYRVKAESATETGGFQQIKIIVVTSTGRQQTRLINFSLIDPDTVGDNA